MGEHREKHTIFGPFPDADPLDTARLFLRTNRYEIVAEEAGPPPESLQFDPSMVTPDDEEAAVDDEVEEASEELSDDEEVDDVEDEDEDGEEDEADQEDKLDASAEPLDEITTTLRAARGARWAGLTSSNMADLETTVELTVVENSIQVFYVVNTTGQFLNDEERAYWKREAGALESFVTGGDLVSVLSDESTRATRARRDLLGWGMWVAAVVFVVVFVLGVLYVRFG